MTTTSPTTIEPHADLREDKLRPPVNDTLLREICRRILTVVDAERIVLFGSHAYGIPTEDSDIDLLVVADGVQSVFASAAQIHQRLSPRAVSLDVIVRTPTQVSQTLKGFDPFMNEVCSKGKVLYERSN